MLQENKQWIETYWAKTVENLRRNSVLLKDKIPLVTIDGVYDALADYKRLHRCQTGFARLLK